MVGFWRLYKKTITNVFYILGIVLIIYLSFRYLIPFFAPFVTAILIATLNGPFVKFFEQKFNIKRSWGAGISLIFTTLLTGSILFLMVVNLYNELVNLQNNLSKSFALIYADIYSLIGRASEVYNNLPPNISAAVDENLTKISGKIETSITFILTWMIGTLSSIPKISLFIVVTILAAYFISADSPKIKDFIFNQFPKKFEKDLNAIKIDVFGALLGYLKALLTLMGFTFLQVSVGLMILDVDYAILMGAIVGLADAIPVVGTGIVLIPWILWLLLTGQMKLAIGLTIIFISGVILRQLLEPKIVGHRMGLHPLVTLFAMYIGLEVFGVVGLFIGPFTLIVLKSLQKSGVIRLWKENQ